MDVIQKYLFDHVTTFKRYPWDIAHQFTHFKSDCQQWFMVPVFLASLVPADIAEKYYPLLPEQHVFDRLGAQFDINFLVKSINVILEESSILKEGPKIFQRSRKGYLTIKLSFLHDNLFSTIYDHNKELYTNVKLWLDKSSPTQDVPPNPQSMLDHDSDQDEQNNPDIDHGSDNAMEIGDGGPGSQPMLAGHPRNKKQKHIKTVRKHILFNLKTYVRYPMSLLSDYNDLKGISSEWFYNPVLANALLKQCHANKLYPPLPDSSIILALLNNNKGSYTASRIRDFLA